MKLRYIYIYIGLSGSERGEFIRVWSSANKLSVLIL